MRVLTLSNADIHAALSPADCERAMAGVLAARVRGEAFNPLRTVTVPPGAAGFIGLMPAYVSAPRRDRPPALAGAAFGLKAICLIPGNPARGLDAHQGTVMLYDGETGMPTAILNASAITEIRTAAVTAVATRALARPGARVLAMLGAGVQARSHLLALADVRPWDEVRVYAPTTAHAEALRDVRPDIAVAASAQDAVRGADVVTIATSAKRPVLEHAWLAPGAHVNAVGASSPTAWEIEPETVAAAALFCDSRESVRNEAGEFRLAIEQGLISGEEHIRAELGEVVAGAHPGRESDNRAHAVPVAGDRRRGPCRCPGRRGRGPPHRPRDRGGPVIALEEIRAARDRVADLAVRTPLVRLHLDDAPAEIHLKLETLQPINSFKIRGAGNAIRAAPAELRAQGLLTASAGNMAQGVAWVARELGLTATIAVPDHAPEAKLRAIERLGGRVLKVPYDEWWQAIVTSEIPGEEGLFIHPVADEAVMAGNGTIGLEIVEDLPDVDTVVIPVGGGGLTVGIASAVKALKPDVRIVTAEPATGAALCAALAAGEPADVDYQPSFVDGSGSRRVLDPMWPRLREVVDEAVAVPIADAEAAVRTLAERVRVIAEGAGALSTAAALAGRAGSGKVACVVSGGNINLATLATIINGAGER